MKRAIILPQCWYKEASVFIARLNILRPRYFLIPLSESGAEAKSNLPFLEEMMAANRATSAMFVIPKSFASGDKIDSWPDLIQHHSAGKWVCSVFFADRWAEVAEALEDFLNEVNTKIETHLTCQYQPVYAEMLKLWEQKGGKAYHPGDFFKEDILPAISQMKGDWVYWGHGEGDRLRGYGQLHVVDLLSNKCETPLNATLWFTCSTLDRDYPENIALAWYQSGATKCLLASPDKVNTEANQLLSQHWLGMAKENGGRTVASLILDILQHDSENLESVLNHYYLLGIPWVSGNI